MTATYAKCLPPVPKNKKMKSMNRMVSKTFKTNIPDLLLAAPKLAPARAVPQPLLIPYQTRFAGRTRPDTAASSSKQKKYFFGEFFGTFPTQNHKKEQREQQRGGTTLCEISLRMVSRNHLKRLSALDRLWKQSRTSLL